MTTPNDLLKASKGHLVGGNVLAIINGEQTTLGRHHSDGIFRLTPEGEKFLMDRATGVEVEVSADPAPKKAAKKAAKAEEAPVGDEDELLSGLDS